MTKVLVSCLDSENCFCHLCREERLLCPVDVIFRKRTRSWELGERARLADRPAAFTWEVSDAEFVEAARVARERGEDAAAGPKNDAAAVVSMLYTAFQVPCTDGDKRATRSRVRASFKLVRGIGTIGAHIVRSR